MFKKGDKVVLIDVDGLGDEWVVDLYNEYEVEEWSEFIHKGELSNITILKGVAGAFHGSRFISIIEYRKQKVKKLLSKYDQKGNTGTV